MKRRLGVLAIVLAIGPGIGCGSEYGIERTTELAAMPDPDCVSKALRSIQAVASVEEEHSESLHAYRYAGESYRARLSFRAGTGAGASFVNSGLSGRSRPSPEEVATTRRMMQAVETRIAFFCAIPELGAGIPERCIGIDCP
jgi:hypothetical protein